MTVEAKAHRLMAREIAYGHAYAVRRASKELRNERD